MKQPSGVSFIGERKSSGVNLPVRNEVNKVRDHSIGSLLHLLQGMFDGIDDSFFELANSARSNNEQNRYFEAMREVRIKRKGIEGHFRHEIAQLFQNPPYLNASTPGSKVEDVSADSLSLVQDDTLEETVATNSMITKARANFPGSLLQFQTRISALYPSADTKNPINPLDPEFLTKAFTNACSDLDVAIREKLIIFKQFDRYVMNNLNDVLDDANQLLVKAGILPNLKLGSQKGPAAPKTSTTATEAVKAESDINADETSEDIFPQIQELLGAIRQRSGQSAPSRSHTGPVQFVADSELLTMLSSVQQTTTPVENLAEGTAAIIDVRDALQNLLAQKGEEKGEEQALNQVDEDLINLVSMLFEFILDDYNLSAPIQVLISRLQIPILKVVIKDKSFFSKATHPARKLLNTLAKAGIGWSDASEKKRDKLYDRIHNVVQRILDEFDGNLALFDELYAEFATFIKKEEKKSKLVEQRTKETEAGRIKSQKAQQEVESVLQSHMAGKRLPEIAIDILQNGWSRVMFLAYLKDDTEHRWQQCVNTVEELIWCLQPHTENEARQRWVKVVPYLLKNIKTGLQEVSFNSSKLDQMMGDLKKVLTDTFKQQSASIAMREIPGPKTDTQPTEDTSSTAEIPSKDKTAVERQKEVEEAAMIEFLAQVDEMVEGSWIEFSLVNGSRFRCKLSTRVEDTDSLIFVNRMGLKVVEKTRKELAQEVRKGRAQPLEQGALLDRAMSSIMTNLRGSAA